MDLGLETPHKAIRPESLQTASFPMPACGPGKSQAELSYDDIASKLIADNFLLTALELHTELVESGKELPRLKEYFSNPGNFEKHVAAKPPEISPTLGRSSSQGTLDSLDFARYSEDGERAADDRVAILEFELRKARETISSLRAHLTQAAETEANTPNSNLERTQYDDPTKPHEQRAINFLVNEYLLKHGYKLTSITFADENEDQDFEDWDDVGLNISKPPDVVHQFRNWQHHVFPQVDSRNCGCQTDDAWNELELRAKGLQLELDKLREELSAVTIEKQVFMNESMKEDVKSPSSPTPGEVTVPVGPLAMKSIDSSDSTSALGLHGGSSMEESEPDIPIVSKSDTQLEGGIHDVFRQDLELILEKLRTENKEGAPSLSHLATLLGASTKRELPEAYQAKVIDSCLHYRPNKQSKLSVDLAASTETSDKVVLLLGACLPHIVPNVILNKREELIPLIVCTINLHPHVKTRDVLLNLLFNLIKRPDEDNRQMILTGFLSIAQHLGLHCVESELLPQCWEQISHRYTERRLLVAEACSVLAPFTSSAIRNSLMLSMLQQMLLEDKDEQVREAAVKSLALVTVYVGDENKFGTCLELALAAIQDQTQGVRTSAIELLVPVLAAWALELNRLFDPFVASILGLLDGVIKEMNTRGPSGTVKVGISVTEQMISVLVTVLKNISSFIFLAVGQKAPFDWEAQMPHNGVPSFPELQNPLQDLSTYWGDSIHRLVSAFNQHFAQDEWQSWPELDWLCDEFFIDLTKLHVKLTMNHQNVILAWIDLYNHLCWMLGDNLTSKKLWTTFKNTLWPPEDEHSDDKQIVSTRLTQSTVPIFVLGVILAFPKPENIQEAVQTLKKILWTLSLYRLPLDSVGFCIQELIADVSYQEPLLTMLWEGVVHTSVQVRESVAEMLGIASQHVSEDYLALKVLPALVTLANDPDISVRVSTVSTFGLISWKCTRKEVRDKAYLQLQMFVDDPIYKDQYGMQLALIHTLGRLAIGDPRFCDDFILLRLATMAASNNNCASRTRRSDVALALLDVYSALMYTPLNKQHILECVLPALKCLQTDVEEVLPGQEEFVRGMVRELEARLEVPRVERSGSLSLAAAAAGQGVEDVKNRVSRLFQSKPATNLPALFKKK